MMKLGASRGSVTVFDDVLRPAAVRLILEFTLMAVDAEAIPICAMKTPMFPMNAPAAGPAMVSPPIRAPRVSSTSRR